MNESFFQPQELYLGQTMCDINLNDPQSVQTAIFNNKKFNNHNSRKKKNSISQINGSLFDMV